MTRCGRCKGRTYINPIRGIGQVECPSCKGTGVKVQSSSLGRNTFTIPVPPGAKCRFCGERPATETHHVCRQSNVKPLVPRDLWEECLTDPRDGIVACRPCHEAAESDPQLAEPRLLHPRFRQWVGEWDLQAAVPRHLQEVAA